MDFAYDSWNASQAVLGVQRGDITGACEQPT